MFRRWVLPVLVILALGVLGAIAISRRAADPAGTPEGAGDGGQAAPPAPRPPEREPPFVVLFGGEMGGRLWIPPCSQFRQGGLSRVGPLLREMTERAHVSMLLDLGDVAGGPGTAGAAEMFAGLAGLGDCGLAVEAVGERDLLVGLERWREVKGGLGPEVKVLCANLLDEEGRILTPAVAHLNAGRKKVLVAAILSPSFEAELRAAGVGVRITDPVPALQDALRASGKADYVILLSHAPAEESRRILKAVPALDVVITAHAGPLPWKEPEIVDGRVLLAGGTGWQFASGVALKDMGEGRKPELGDSFSRAVRWSTPQNPALQFHADMALRVMGQKGFLEAALRESADRAPADAPAYAGPGACASCHPAAHGKWKEEPHARSMAKVREKGFEAAPNCLACHATAPGRRGGHLSPGDAQAAVSCEACHGPGAAHVAAEGRAPLEAARESCVRCHTTEMSPAFRFEEAWPRVEHGR